MAHNTLRAPEPSKTRTNAMRSGELIDLRDKEGVLWGTCLTDTFFAYWDTTVVDAHMGTAIGIPIWLLDALAKIGDIVYLNIYLAGDHTRYLIDLDSARECKDNWVRNGEKCLILDKNLFDRRTRRTNPRGG